MGEEQIRKIDGLSSSQKNLLILKMNTSKTKLNRTPIYSGSLEKVNNSSNIVFSWKKANKNASKDENKEGEGIEVIVAGQ